MKRTMITFVFMSVMTGVFAQNNPAKLKFQDAEAAYSKQDYTATITKLNEAERMLKGTSDKILHLKIASRNSQIETTANDDLESIALLKQDIASYLKKYGTSDDKYREVFQLGEKYANYKISLTQIQEAKKGVEVAMLDLASAYYDIAGYTQAMEWYKKAADKGNAFAAFKIGALYDYGEGVKKDYQAAMDWYKIAASKNLPVATAAIGWLYYNGQGVQKDRTKALSYFQSVLPAFNQAAEKGEIYAMEGLSNFHVQGIALPQDFSKAFQWSTKAALAGSARSMCELALFYQLGYGVKKDLEKSVEWFLKSADKGFTFSMFCLGGAYYSGIGVIKNDAKSVEWLLKAAELGNAQAMESVAAFYFQGIGVPANADKGVEWFLKAADSGNMSALVSLGNAYRDGTGVQRSYAKAKECYERAINETDDLAALRHLGALYYEFDGYGNTIDYTKAASYYNRAAVKGDGVSMKRLSEIYTSGKGVKKDKKIAKEWLDKSETAEIKQ